MSEDIKFIVRIFMEPHSGMYTIIKANFSKPSWVEERVVYAADRDTAIALAFAQSMTAGCAVGVDAVPEGATNE